MAQVVPLGMLFPQWRYNLLFALYFIWSRVKTLSYQPLRHWPAAVSAYKVYAEGKKKKKDDSIEPNQSLDSKMWHILSDIRVHLKGLDEKIEVV